MYTHARSRPWPKAPASLPRAHALPPTRAQSDQPSQSPHVSIAPSGHPHRSCVCLGAPPTPRCAFAPPGGAAGLPACLIPVGGGQRVVRTTRPCSGPLDRSQVRGHPAGEPSRAPPEVINGQIDWILKSGVRSTLLWRWTRGRTWVSYVSRRARTSQGRWREPTNAPLLSNGKQTTQRRGRRRRGVIDQEAEQQNFCWRQILVLAA